MLVSLSNYAQNIPDPVNTNLLHNSNFADPVNQRNATTYTYDSGGDSEYCIDRWMLSAGSITVEAGRINLVSATLVQYIDGYNLLAGKVLTLSVNMGGSVTSMSGILSTSTVGNSGLSFSYDTSRDCIRVNITGDGRLYWAKLEVGDTATTYVPKSRNQEYLDCYRYYVRYQTSTNSITKPTAACWAEQTYGMAYIVFPTAMRVKPTMSYAGLTFNNGEGAVSITNAVLEASDEHVLNHVCIQFTTASAIASNNPGMLRILATGYLIFDAEIH